MNRTLQSALCLFAALPVFAGPADNPELERWLRKSVMTCPDATYEFVTVDVQGPEEFEAYRFKTEGSGECRDMAYALYSPESGQVLAGQVIPVPPGEGSPSERIGELLRSRMKIEVSVRPYGDSIEDGVQPLMIEKSSPEGIVPIRGWLDSSGTFFVLGRRGNLSRDPGMTLLEAIGVENGVSKGPENAQVRIVELSDLQCPACQKAHTLVEPILEKHASKVHYTRLDMPVTDYHDWAMKAALGAVAIQKMDESRYWAYVDYIFENQANLSAENIDQFLADFVEGSGLDGEQFARHLDSAEAKKQLNAQVGAAFSNGIFGTPTFIVNGRTIFYGRGADNIASYLTNLLE